MIARFALLALVLAQAAAPLPAPASDTTPGTRVAPAAAIAVASPVASPDASPTPQDSPEPENSPSPAATPNASPTPRARPNRGASPRPSAAASAPGSPFAGLLAPQSYKAFVAKAQRQHGLIDILHKDDEVYFDLGPAQFDRPFVVAPVLASGVGDEAFAGRLFDTFLLEFKRVGKRVLWVDVNADFSAPPNSSAANALAISVTDSVIASTPIVAEDDDKTHAVVSASFFLTDFENVARSLGGPAEPLALFGGPARAGFGVDASRSYLERTKALPRNDEILASLAFSGPAGDLSGAPDGRGVRLRMHYSIVDAPADGYVPRLADDRVGYFITAQKRFDDDTRSSPFVRYIDRWNFKNGPIVYYLTNEIPPQYKPAIRSALLTWNGAFAKIGIPNAIEVRDQPNDPAFDPDDARYSTVRWITSDRSAFAAYGPHIADPRTGEIMRVEIVIDGEALRSVKRGYVDAVAPSRAYAIDASGVPEPATAVRAACADTAACDAYEETSAALAATGTVALRTAGASPAAIERYAEAWLRSAVLHESGHNFGLRHNFAASALYSLHDLHDEAFTRRHGLVGSVMEYAPVNIAPLGRPNGELFQTVLGPYDEWAIRYGYQTFAHVARPEDELVRLRGIASESTRPAYAYATDEDANGPLAVDPRVATFDLSSDPLAYDRNQFVVFDQLFARLDRTYPRADQPYYEERRTFETMLRGYERAALLAAKYLGGIETSRAHRGQPGGAPPFSPVPRARSLAAFRLLDDHVFSSRALHFSPQLLADLGPNHYLHRGVDDVERPDFPIDETVSAVQDAVLFAAFSPDAMSRLADERERLRPGQTAMSLDDLYTWMQAAVWDDLGRDAIGENHRALQRRYTNLLVAISLAPSFLLNAIGYPSDTAPLARYELRRLVPAIDRALRSPHLDVATRAHLEDVRSRAAHALDAGAVRGA